MKAIFTKVILLIALSLSLASCTTNQSTDTTENSLTVPEDNVELYLAAREIVTSMAMYESDAMTELQEALIELDLNATVNENIAKIESLDAATLDTLETIRNAYASLEQIDEDSVLDIYEDNDLPVMGQVIDNEDSQQACLTDAQDFRPVLNMYMLDDPTEAIGTILCVPSVRGYYSETRDYANIFNEKGYNVLTLEPRFNQVVEDDGTYYLMNLDCIRAIRYIKYYADDLQIDVDKLVVIAGSKGNYIHMMSTLYYDLTPTEYADLMGVAINDYIDDEIDQVEANVAVQIWNYGNLYALDENNELSLDDRGVYSEENANNGLQLPAMMFIGGNQDAMVSSLMPDIIRALIDFNDDETKLYDINWEIHVFDQVPHGSGAGVAYENVSASWDEVDAFIQMSLQ